MILGILINKMPYQPYVPYVPYVKSWLYCKALSLCSTIRSTELVGTKTFFCTCKLCLSLFSNIFFQIQPSREMALLPISGPPDQRHTSGTKEFVIWKIQTYMESQYLSIQCPITLSLCVCVCVFLHTTSKRNNVKNYWYFFRFEILCFRSSSLRN